MVKARVADCSQVRIVVFAFAFALLSPPAPAQRVLEAKGFQTADYYEPPHETQVKALLKGARARPLENDRVYVYDGTELQTFTETGQPELIVRAPEYTYDQHNQTASSPGPLHVETADGEFSIEGEGFLFQQTNSALWISNRVHTVVQPSLLEAPGATNRTRSSVQQAPIEIFSRQFEYQHNSGLGIYRDQVRVQGTNMDLSGGRLTLKVPVTDTRRPTGLESITAEQNVAMSYSGIQATGQVAIYSAQTGLATVSGHPAWKADQREGHADELVVDRTNRIFYANGHAWLKLPGRSLGNAGFLTSSKEKSAGASDTTNRFVEIASDSYQFRTNSAVFRKDVHVSEIVSNRTGGTMTCALLTANFIGTNELQNLVAENNVVIEEETNRFTAQTAVFTATNGVLEMTGTPEPTWKSGPRSGHGKLIRVDTQHDEMFVRGDAFMRLPGEQLGQTEGLPASASAPRPKQSAPQFADITCEEYLVRPDHAVFRGGVREIHPRMNTDCQSLTVIAPQKSQTVLIAEGRVLFVLINEKGEKIYGTGDKAVYTNSITSTLTNELLTLTGNPARLVMATATNENNVIVLDRTRNTLINRGDYRIFGTAKVADTNLFTQPKNKMLK
jgi:lipopolysaccharide export system protein LptA